MSTKEQFDEFDAKIMNVDEVGATDIKLNPDYYLHLSLSALSKVFMSDISAGEMFQKYRHIVEHLEILSKASNQLDAEQFDKDIEKFKKENKEYKDAEKGTSKSMILAREKLRLMMTRVFSNKTATDPIAF